MEIKFKMRLLNNLTLLVDWENISMADAYVVPYSFNLTSKQTSGQHILDYFNWVFDLIIPWVNSAHPDAVSKFMIPSTFPGVMEIKEMTLEVRDNYINFGLNPKFIVTSAHTEQLRVLTKN
jgi:hypothetical protein